MNVEVENSLEFKKQNVPSNQYDIETVCLEAVEEQEESYYLKTESTMASIETGQLQKHKKDHRKGPC